MEEFIMLNFDNKELREAFIKNSNEMNIVLSDAELNELTSTLSFVTSILSDSTEPTVDTETIVSLLKELQAKRGM
jgi:hypothetical protein